MLHKTRLAALGAAVALILPAAHVVASVAPLNFASGVPARENPFDAIIASGPIGPLRDALAALSRGQVADALVARDAMGRNALDRKILTWAVAYSGGRNVPSSLIAEAAKGLPDWPGADTFRRNSERALFRENPEPVRVLAALGATKPETYEGTVLLTRAYLTLGKADDARKLLSPFWRTEKLQASQEAQIIEEFGAVLQPLDHRLRMERMLYAERVNSAQRVAVLAGAKELAEAWGAVLRGDKKAAALLDAVPNAQRGAGYVFAKARMLRRQGKDEAAAEVMLAAPTEVAALIDPDAWWIERRVLSRELVDLGDFKTAYRLVAAHAAESPANKADAEFHAGWYALRGLEDPQLASRHFARIAEDVSGAISLSRAFYWMGRAAEAGHEKDYAEFYRRAAGFGTTFYGQLAAAKLGQAQATLSSPSPSADERAKFVQRDAVRAIARLQEAGSTRLANALYRGLADDILTPNDLTLLAEMAEKEGNNFLALRIAKAGAARGLEIGTLTHPLGAIPETADVTSAGKALAYAIARQESEFNVGAVSGAGAQGLLQLMPGTARQVALKAGLPFAAERLTTDAGYNATLGAAYLQEQLDRFGGSYVLTFASYNAGPGRVREWLRKYGDPRGQDLDGIVDWIERIPYGETRAYVQRVMENYQVYKLRLTGKADIGSDLVSGRRR
ncbi:MAG: lytic transglycosylase domain-containing protein [Methylobacterium mesophilicum]|nr:lytic transglycosylase domain-containing protein [Methylobacterium mesophilicum]